LLAGKRPLDASRHNVRMAVLGEAPFEEAALNTLDAPAVLLTCKPGVAAESKSADVEAGSQTKVVVQEDVVATGQPREDAVEPAQ
jgi:hypothetical protein